MYKPVNLEELRQGFRGKRYAELIQHHINQFNDKQLLESCVGTTQLLPEDAQAVVTNAIDDWNAEAYKPEFWRLDCAYVFDWIIRDMTERLAKVSISPDGEILFNAFQVITMNYAVYASRQRSMRKFMGIRKGIFG
jgi:hypothetical protein